MFLPSPGSRFPVGATTFRLAVPRTGLSNVKVRSASSSKLRDALVLEEVVFTAYYPAEVWPGSVPKGIHWLSRPLRTSLLGFSAYSGLSAWLLLPVVYFFGFLLKIPVHPDAPLLNPCDVTTSESSKSSPWPLVVFSHGLGGSRTGYSQFCSRVASSGRVVLAMEHRDGSGHAVMPLSSDSIIYTKESDLVWPPGHPIEECNMLSFRTQQLEFRRREIYHALRAIRDLVNGGRIDVQSTGDTSLDWSKWSGVGSEKPIECKENVILAGHSFGAATVFSILLNVPPENEPQIPVEKALMLDPWLEPLSSPPIPQHTRFKDGRLPRILVINSEKFTLWKDHFARLMDIGKSWSDGRWELLTIVRSQHISFSDFSILPWVSSKAAHLILDKILQLSITFLDGEGKVTTMGSSVREMEVRVIGRRADGREKKQLVGNLCDVILHQHGSGQNSYQPDPHALLG